MVLKVKWGIRPGDKMVLLSPGGRPIGIWVVKETTDAKPDSITVQLERGDDDVA